MQLIYFSPVPWDSYEQRPHYVVRHFLAQGARRAVWLDPHPARLPRFEDRHRLRGPGRPRPLWLDRPSGLTVVGPRAWPIEPLPGGPAVNRWLFWRQLLRQISRQAGPDSVIGIGRPTALALAALESLPRAWSFYDAMDMFPEFNQGLSRRHIARTEGVIARQVDRVFVSSRALARKFEPLARHVTLMPNAYDMALLPPLAASPGLARAGLGFLGCLGRWFDWSLTIKVAHAAAPLPVTLIGPRPLPGPPHLPDNVRWLPECHQAGTIAHLSSFAAGLIPFTRDPLTAGVDPIKYYQYRGAGLPVLTTAFGEMADRTEADDTFFLDRPEGIRVAIDRALSRKPDQIRVAAFRASNTWQERFSAARLLCPS